MKVSPGTTREHRMEFGAEVRDTGEVRFHLWAPGVEAVSLCLHHEGVEALFPMKRERSGWYRFITRTAGPGDRYLFQLPSGMRVPDPASRFQPDGVHGPSEIIDPAEFNWSDETWPGRPWEETVLYELHVGTFSPEGTFAGVERRLDHLVELGVTGIELMPIGAFPGRRNWGYDGVLPFALAVSYGRPESLKQLIVAAHARNIMVLLDVVYNHFGPEGNYLHLYAPQFFTKRHQTPWGEAINFDGDGSAAVRDFFIHNALYWLEEYHFDGLRLDAVHAIHDKSGIHFLEELSEAVRLRFGSKRHIHLVLENDLNQAHYLRESSKSKPAHYRAQLNDDLHHALHVLLTGEKSGYYMDYAESPSAHLGRCLAGGFAYQGEPSTYRNNMPRGETSADLPPTAFIGFLQNHDQVGNRALGERLSVLTAPRKLRAALAVVLLSPSVPLLFMGEEWGCGQPFFFFCDFEPIRARAVAEGRRREFARFPEFNDPESRKRIPDPADPRTFVAATLDWRALSTKSGRSCVRYYRELLKLRQREIIPRLKALKRGESSYERLGTGGLRVVWLQRSGEVLLLLANLSDHPLVVEAPLTLPPIFLEGALVPESNGGKTVLEAWSVVWYLNPSSSGE